MTDKSQRIAKDIPISIIAIVTAFYEDKKVAVQTICIAIGVTGKFDGPCIRRLLNFDSIILMPSEWH